MLETGNDHSPPTPAFRSYFEIFSGHGEVDAQRLENILLLVGISLTPAQVDGALKSADVDGECGEAPSRALAGSGLRAA